MSTTESQALAKPENRQAIAEAALRSGMAPYEDRTRVQKRRIADVAKGLPTRHADWKKKRREAALRRMDGLKVPAKAKPALPVPRVVQRPQTGAQALTQPLPQESAEQVVDAWRQRFATVQPQLAEWRQRIAAELAMIQQEADGLPTLMVLDPAAGKRKQAILLRRQAEAQAAVQQFDATAIGEIQSAADYSAWIAFGKPAAQVSEQELGETIEWLKSLGMQSQQEFDELVRRPDLVLELLRSQGSKPTKAKGKPDFAAAIERVRARKKGKRR